MLDANFSFMWRPPWLSKLSMCSPDFTTTMGIMALLWALKNSPTVPPALSPTHLHLHLDQFPVAGGGEDFLSDILSFWYVVLDLFWMWRAQPELDTVRAVADAPEEVSVVSVDVDEAGEASVMHEPAALLARVRTCN